MPVDEDVEHWAEIAGRLMFQQRHISEILFKAEEIFWELLINRVRRACWRRSGHFISEQKYVEKFPDTKYNV